MYLRTSVKERRVLPNDGALARALRGMKRAPPSVRQRPRVHNPDARAIGRAWIWSFRSLSKFE